ncbi:hypothetical protein G6N82_10390 [Altererythrobacter sp. BO-6]|uniref:hypothetical protein n=1 Tax=Altererythrobacter sp. BO-6 TaxID=2604537 RepID=UPI0013E1639D|nr:hypothetical protein [Altererythrobacter sp. BO-6]QIG54504.1 hypothetical protein G6N82_10390 [Altererythrobacter sp. BO-6]
MRKFAALCSIVAGFAAIAAAQDYTPQVEHTPNIGAASHAEIGDVVYSERKGSIKECVTPKFNENKNTFLGAYTFSVLEGEPLCKDDSDGKYITQYDNYRNNTVGDSYRYKVNVDFSRNEVKFCSQGACIKRPSSDVEHGKVFVMRPNTSKLAIELSGLSGDAATFLFSEVDDRGNERTREFTVNLSDTKKVRYRGAEIEVTGHQDGSINYVVLNGFS